MELNESGILNAIMKIKKIILNTFIVLCILFINKGMLVAERCIPYEILGADEFIRDSILVQEKGKVGILQLLGKCAEELPEETQSKYQDTIKEGDILNITVYHPTRTEWMLAIHQFNAQRGGVEVIRGKISLPGFDPIFVDHMTLPEARQEIRSRIRAEIKDADAFVSFKSRNTNTVLLSGKIAGTVVAVDGNMRLFEVLSKAHIHVDANLFASYVLRDGVNLNVDFYKLIREGDMSQNIVMKAGDKVFVASLMDHYALVMGEIGTQRPLMGGFTALRGIPLPTGSVPLREALAQAYGIQYNTCKNHLQIIRAGSGSPKIFVISWNDIDNQPNKNLLLIPGDLVYLSLKPINNWKIFIDELEGTLIAMSAAQFIHRISR
jgi:polysaccharide biosynthesis/export protein